MDYANMLVEKEIENNRLDALFSEEMKEEAVFRCSKNLDYDMDDEFAVKDAVGSVLVLNKKVAPPDYDFWVAFDPC